MALVSIPYTFQPNTLIQSAQVNSNFSALSNYINSGSGTFSGSGYAVLPGGLYLQWGNTSTAADGTGETTVNFPVAFPTQVFQVVATPDNAFQTNPWGLTTQTNSPTAASFKLNVTGGAPGNSVTVRWIAIGN